MVIKKIKYNRYEEPSGYCAGGSFSYKVAMKSLNLIILSIRY